MSSPIAIPIASRSRPDATTVYVPVHRRSPGSYGSTWSSRASSPTPSSSALSSLSSPIPAYQTLPATPGVFVYTPAELLLLARSPLAKLSAGDIDALRATVPEVVQSRRRRKALVWHTRQLSNGNGAMGQSTPSHTRSHRGRTGLCGSQSQSPTSESQEDRTRTWRKI